MTESTGHRHGDMRVALSVAAAMLVTALASAPARGAEKDATTALGREVFTKLAVPQCGICHALQDAGTTGEIGAKLEELKPDAARVAEAVRKGLGVMPPYAGKLTEEQIRAVAHYVSAAVKGAK